MVILKKIYNKDGVNGWLKQMKKEVLFTINNLILQPLALKRKTITSWWIAKNILQDDNGLSDKLYEYIPSIIKTNNSVITKGLDDES